MPNLVETTIGSPVEARLAREFEGFIKTGEQERRRPTVAREGTATRWSQHFAAAGTASVRRDGQDAHERTEQSLCNELLGAASVS
jgi:hypothetical protein